MAVSAIAIPGPLLVRSMIQSHDGGLLQPYDKGSAGFRRRGTSTGAPLKMLTATNEEVRVHPASPSYSWPSHDGACKGVNVAVTVDRCRFAIMQDAVLM